MFVSRCFNAMRTAGLAAALMIVWAGVSIAQQARAKPPTDANTLVIDDFSGKDANSPLGTRWTLLPGRGVGEMPRRNVRIEENEQRTYLHLTAPGSRGGQLVEARLYLHPQRRSFDASGYLGIRLTAKGSAGPWWLRLHTQDTRSAAQLYQAEIRVSDQWQQIELPFLGFMPVAAMTPLNPAGLRSIAVVAGPTGADIQIDNIAFYRGPTMYKKLTPEEQRVILRKGTEAPFSGEYNEHFEKGVYTCRQCGTELFESSSKFRSECGWPSFDEQIPGRVKWQRDPDGQRTEIICATCGGHLGHVFLGEHLTAKNTRYCVNSISMDFIPAEQRQAQTKPKTGRALFASGCFWGTEYYLQRAPGVISTTVGYTGGHVDNPTYKQVCTNTTGHAETVEVTYDPSKTTYEALAKLFFETHDFTQLNRQGPDVGTQYRSAIFYLDDEQKQTAERLVQTLRQKGYDVKTEIAPAGKFWPAEDYHQDYYNHTGGTPYCHLYRKIF